MKKPINFRHSVVASLTITLLLSACGGSSGDSTSLSDVTGDTVLAPETDTEDENNTPVIPTFTDVGNSQDGAPVSLPQIDARLFPQFTVWHAEEFTNIEQVDFDESRNDEQVLLTAGILARENPSGIILDGYETYCELSVLPTSATTPDTAYGSLTNGNAEVIFSLEDSFQFFSLTSINAIEQDGRTGQAYEYFLEFEDRVINGRGRAFYFNDNDDNLVRSSLLYVECFGFSDEFFDNATIIDAHLDSLIFSEN